MDLAKLSELPVGYPCSQDFEEGRWIKIEVTDPQDNFFTNSEVTELYIQIPLVWEKATWEKKNGHAYVYAVQKTSPELILLPKKFNLEAIQIPHAVMYCVFIYNVAYEYEKELPWKVYKVTLFEHYTLPDNNPVDHDFLVYDVKLYPEFKGHIHKNMAKPLPYEVGYVIVYYPHNVRNQNIGKSKKAVVFVCNRQLEFPPIKVDGEVLLTWNTIQKGGQAYHGSMAIYLGFHEEQIQSQNEVTPPPTAPLPIDSFVGGVMDSLNDEEKAAFRLISSQQLNDFVDGAVQFDCRDEEFNVWYYARQFQDFINREHFKHLRNMMFLNDYEKIDLHQELVQRGHQVQMESAEWLVERFKETWREWFLQRNGGHH